MPIEDRTENSVRRITLNRPQKRNALDREMLGQLNLAVGGPMLEDEARVVLIEGIGRDFCSGLDVGELQETAGASVESHLESAHLLAEIYNSIRNQRRPVVAAVRGRALGGGCGLATACDVILASESA